MPPTIALAATVAAASIVGPLSPVDLPAARSIPEAAATIEVVATTSILADVTTAIAGDVATVSSLMPAGVDPHTFELSAADAAELLDADLIVANGLGLEHELEGALDAARAEGARVIEVGTLVDPLLLDESADEHEGEADHDHAGDEGVDPHFWTDPQRMIVAAEAIGAELITAAPGETATIEANVAAYVAELEQLDADIAAMVSPLDDEQRQLITSHDVLGYFAARYGFTVVGTVIPSSTTLSAPSTRQLAELVDVIDTTGVDVIFVAAGESSGLADTVAGEAGIEVEVVELQLESLGSAESGTDTYATMLHAAATDITTAIG